MNPVGHPVTHRSARIQFILVRNYKSLILSFCVTPGDVNAQNLKNKSDEVIDYPLKRCDNLIDQPTNDRKEKKEMKGTR